MHVIGCCDGGLCNRIGNLLGSERIARKLNAGFGYCWPVNQYVGANYQDLFAGKVNLSLAPLWETHRRIRVFNDVPNVGYQIDPADCQPEGHDDVIVIKSWTAIGFKGETQEEIYREINWDLVKPGPEVVDAVRLFGEEANISERVGVHIRMTDNPRRYHVTLDQLDFIFRKLMEEKVFLTTDNEEVEEYVLGKFKDKTVCFPKADRSRGSVVGMRNALIDLRLLSLCRRIIGTKWSSFTDIAARWGGRPREVFNPSA